MSVVLDVRELRKSHGANALLDGVSFSVSAGEKVGVIGRNGSGKSTLFRILAGLEGHDGGTISTKRDLTVGYLEQDPDLDANATVFSVVGEGRATLRKALAEYQAVASELGEAKEPGRIQHLMDRQSTLSARIEREGGWDWNHRVEAALTRLGIDGWERTLEHLSGGERRRVALAQTLLSDPDLLLLDEPTNHLDAETVLWLEETLFDFSGAALVVTHDRYFLDRVVDRMLEVANGSITWYEGGYTEYLEARTEREAREKVEEAKRLRFLEKELAWARRSPPARTGKQKARRRRAGKLAGAQRERERARTREVELEVGSGPRLGKQVLEIQALSMGYGGHTLIRDFSDRILTGERIGIVGPNGAGKTTLLRLLIGSETPDRGDVVVGENTRIGYFDQNREVDPELSVERAVSESDWVEMGGRSLHLRAYLDRFLFPPHVQRQTVGSLSGGERNRLLLARLFLEEFNLLILDEPTNDLDLDTLRILEDAIEAFPGGLIMVTHDRYLLDKLATSLWIFEGEGRIHRHHGSWDAYLARKERLQVEADAGRRDSGRRQKEKREEKRAESGGERRGTGSTRTNRLSYQEQKELDGMEDRIRLLETERDAISKQLADPGFYRDDSESVSRTTGRFRELEAEIERLYGRWLELEERAS